jgi:D-3-phosphoglycerate dehydrogenase
MFRVGDTRDFLRPDGTNRFGDIGLDGRTAAGVAWDWLPAVGGDIPAEVAAGFDGLLVLGPRASADTVAAERLKVVARFGVGYDTVDVPACTAAGVLLTIPPEVSAGRWRSPRSRWRWPCRTSRSSKTN